MYEFKKLADDIGIEVMDLKNLYCSFIEEMDEEISLLKKHIDKKEFENLESIVHNIKGISSNLLIDDIYEHCQIFDSELKNNTFDNVTSHMEILETLYANSKKIIIGYFKIK